MLMRYLGALRQSKYDSALLSLMTPGSLWERLARSCESAQSLHIEQGRVALFKLLPLWRAFRNARPDLIHGWMYHGNIAASIGSFISFRDMPVIWSIHHSLYDTMTEKPLTRSLIRLSAKLSFSARAIAYCSRVSASQHEALGFDTRHRHVIYNGIDCDVFKPDFSAKPRLKKLLNIPQQRQIIGSIGRFHPMKNQIVQVHAMASLLKEGYDIQGLFVGAGHTDGLVRKIARELGIDDRISTLGIEADVPNIMRGLDLHAVSSSWGETFSLSTAEAMACGVPAIVTDIGDCPWVVGDTGLVVECDRSDAMASAFRKLLGMPPVERLQLGLKARQRVVDKFSLKQYVTGYLDLYSAVQESRALGFT